MKQNTWYSIKELIEEGSILAVGQEFIGYSNRWIDLDYNINGTRICFLNEDADGPWISTYWNNYQDCYETDDKTVPTHIMLIPKNPL